MLLLKWNQLVISPRITEKLKSTALNIALGHVCVQGQDASSLVIGNCVVSVRLFKEPLTIHCMHG